MEAGTVAVGEAAVVGVDAPDIGGDAASWGLGRLPHAGLKHLGRPALAGILALVDGARCPTRKWYAHTRRCPARPRMRAARPGLPCDADLTSAIAPKALGAEFRG